MPHEDKESNIMNRIQFASKIFFTAVAITIIGIGGYTILKQDRLFQSQKDLIKITTSKSNQAATNSLKFNIIYPPTPSSFGCNPNASLYESPQGKVIQTYDQWEDLYRNLLKECFMKTDAPHLIDFEKQSMISVFAGRSCVTSKVDVQSITRKYDKVIVHSVITSLGCVLPSFSFPFTLVAIEKTNLPVKFSFESVEDGR